MSATKGVWLDIRNLQNDQILKFTNLAVNNGYNGIFLSVEQIDIIEIIPKSVKIVIYIIEQEIERCNNLLKYVDIKRVIIIANNQNILDKINYETEIGIYMKVENKEVLDEVVESAKLFQYILIEFDMQTNIPLELVLACSQHNNACICKIVKASYEGWIASMVMEMGCNIVILKTDDMQNVIEMQAKIVSMQCNKLNIKELTVTELKHVGMGDRVCIDTTSMMKENEGFILGSTSSGGILVSSETHYLPYMELRPFRVNAGGLHMYIWNMNGDTYYLSELQAGKGVMAVDSSGNTRGLIVGRIKIERRPLLLIKAVEDSGIEVNLFVQDDWHVRIIGSNGSVLNCTELEPGDRVLGYTCKSGRHVGINIDETVIEK